MKTIQDTAAFLFIAALGVLTVVSVLGVWDFFARDVIFKSFQTLGLVALIAVVVLSAGKYIGGLEGGVIIAPNPLFQVIRRGTLGLLIIFATLIALLGVMTIWEVIANTDVLYRSLSTLAILAFASFITVVVCMERENHSMIKERKSEFSLGTVILVLVFGWMTWWFSSLFS